MTTKADQQGRRRPAKAVEDEAQAAAPDGDSPPVPDAQADAGDTPPPAPGPAVPQVPPPPGGGRPAAAPAPQPSVDAARPTFGQRVGRAVGWVLKLLLIVLLGTAVGTLLFLTVPSLFERVAQPLAESNAAVSRIESQVVTLEARIGQAQAAQSEAAVEQRSALVDTQQALNARLAAAEERLAAAEARLRDAEDEAAAQAGRIDELETALGDTVEQLEAVGEQLDALEEELPGTAEYAEFNRQVLLIRAWQDVLKARLRMLENNAGLAQEELERALDTLDRAYAVSSAEQREALDPVIERLSAAYEAIQANPFVASSDLEVGWHALGLLIEPLGLRDQPAAELTPTPTPAEETPIPADATPTPTPAP